MEYLDVRRTFCVDELKLLLVRWIASVDVVEQEVVSQALRMASNDPQGSRCRLVRARRPGIPGVTDGCRSWIECKLTLADGVAFSDGSERIVGDSYKGMSALAR